MLSKNTVKYIQSSHHKKFRDEENIFLAEGSKVVEELLLSKKFLFKIICGVDDWIKKNEILLHDLSKENIITITDSELEKISLQKTPNKVVAVFEKKENEEIILANRLTITLDEIQDPGNLGTIIRIADWFGIKNIVCSNDTVDYYNPKVIQSTMGSLSRVNISYVDLKKFIEENINIKVYAATLDGKDVSLINKISEGIILIGNESKGIKNELLQLAFEKITISKKGEAESLNAAVATGIILSHIT